MFGLNKKTEMPTQETALPGREMTMPVPRNILCWAQICWPRGREYRACHVRHGVFLGAERKFWQAEGVYSTQVGYAAGLTPNPTYEEVCSGAPATMKLCRWFSTPRVPALPICLPCFGKIMIRPRACVRVMISARNTVPEFTHFRPNRPNWPNQQS